MDLLTYMLININFSIQFWTLFTCEIPIISSLNMNPSILMGILPLNWNLIFITYTYTSINMTPHLIIFLRKTFDTRIIPSALILMLGIHEGARGSTYLNLRKHTSEIWHHILTQNLRRWLYVDTYLHLKYQ